MATFTDTLRDLRTQLLDASDQARQEATDSGTDNSPWWTITAELDTAHDAVDAACEAAPEED